MLFQEAVGVGDGLGEAEALVVKAAGVGVTSDVPKRPASRIPSRPLIEPVLSVWLKFEIVKDPVGKTVGDGVGVGDGDGEGEAAAATVPKLTGPVAVIRTGGRGYWGVNAVASVRSQVSRYGSHRFGTRNQLTPPVAPVPATGQAANELK